MKVNKAVLKTIKIVLGITIAALVVVGTYRLCVIGYDMGYRVFTEPAMDTEPGKDVVVTIESGMSKSEIGQMLEDKGLIRDAQLFVFQVYLSDYKNSIVPGTYTLNTSMTAKQMMIAIENENIKPESTEDDTESGTEAIDNEESSEVNTEE